MFSGFASPSFFGVKMVLAPLSGKDFTGFGNAQSF
jgi:hypothetical protein